MNINSFFSDLGVSSPLIYGCMGLGGGWNKGLVGKEDILQAHSVIDCVLEQGINLFDHADIYTFGKAEQVFGHVLSERPELKESIILQSKCGIRFDDDKGPKRYDFSQEWITQSVDGILQRLNIEHLPILLLHRPDPLMDVKELANTLHTLHSSGKIGAIGVSNMSAAQMALLQSQIKLPIVTNQLELSLSKLDWVEQGVLNNVGSTAPFSMQAGTIEYCQINNVQLQSWGSLSQGLFSGNANESSPQNVHATANVVERLANELNTTKEAIVLAWVMKHPTNIMPVIGSTSLGRIKAATLATQVALTRGQWYELYVTSRGGELP